MRGPIVAAEVFTAVMAAADWRCQCRGTCGREHPADACGVKHEEYAAGHWARLTAAPAEAVPDHQAVTLPPSALRAWCPSCLHHARTRARAAARTAAVQAQTPLF